MVLCGHSHVPFLGRDKGLVVLNPGSIGPRRFQLPITLGVLDLAQTGISLRHVSCETGETWLPG
jgi:predicted phosphodiesterase